MSADVALCSVVTEAVLEEFLLMKQSFELFHGDGWRWVVRCDRASLPVLARMPGITCQAFTDRTAVRPSEDSAEFRPIVAEKMRALEDGWTHDGVCAAIFMDADLVTTAPFVQQVLAMEGDVVLTPNHYPAVFARLAKEHGEFNSGFVCEKTPRFHRWWRHAFETQPSLWTDQACLNGAAAEFAIARTGEESNVGFWRSADPPPFVEIPAACTFLHAHFFQGLESRRELIGRAFALHCLRFLLASPEPRHRQLLHAIVQRDRTGWYKASLRLCGLWPEPRRRAPAVRAREIRQEARP
jgi:hypothetical protein